MKVIKIPISKIKNAPYNPRKDLKPTDPEYVKIKQSIQEFDLVEPLVWNERSGNLVGGHQRLKVLKEEMGLTEVYVSVVNLDDKKEKSLNIALNKISGDWDLPQLKELLVGLDDGLNLTLTGFDESELKKLIDWDGKKGNVDEDEAPGVPEKPRTKPGDLYLLGEHRLLCGDSTSAENVQRLLEKIIPNLMVTDPPYGVDYDANWRNVVDRANGKPFGAMAVGKVTNDTRSDWREAWALFPGNIAYVWHAGRYAKNVQESLESCGFEIRNQIIWGKNNFAISRGDYHWQHEPCWYAVRKKGDWTGDRSQTTLWQIDKPLKSETGHSTQKPVECMRRPIMNNSRIGDAVYDPFLGSGTTLIAAEKQERKCFGMEIDPAYCDVIVKRWENFTGKKATRS